MLHFSTLEPVPIWQVAQEETFFILHSLLPSHPAASPDHRMEAVRSLGEGRGGRVVRAYEARPVVYPGLTLGKRWGMAARQWSNTADERDPPET